jgi:RimJ/RimL family protein N-acetyltransferase
MPLPAPPALIDGVVRLRPPEERDVPAMVRACRDPEIPRWTTVPAGYTEAHARSFLAECGPWLAEGSRVVLAVADAAGDALLGMIDLRLVAGDTGEAGYWAAPWARGRGVTTRALGLLTGWALGPGGLARVELRTMLGNVPSQGVALRCGYRWVRVVRGARCGDEESVDLWVWERRAAPPGTA